jgi:DNA-binding beta-propeller fold protein YncE
VSRSRFFCLSLVFVANTLLSDESSSYLLTNQLPYFLGNLGLGPNQGPSSVASVGKTCYITNSTANSLSVIDISHPTNMVLLSTITGSLTAPSWITVFGTTGYVLNGTTSGKLDVYDLSSPTSLLWKNEVTLHNTVVDLCYDAILYPRVNLKIKGHYQILSFDIFHKNQNV